MKFLFDANVSPALVGALEDLYPESRHVMDAGLERALDLEVWRYARDRGFVLVTRDSDFNHLALLHGAPPKVVWLRLGNCSTSEVGETLREREREIRRFVERSGDALLAIRRA